MKSSVLVSWLLCGFLLLRTCHGRALVRDRSGVDEDRYDQQTSASRGLEEDKTSPHPFRLAVLYPEVSFVQSNLSSAWQELMVKNEVMPWVTETLSRYIKVCSLFICVTVALVIRSKFCCRIPSYPSPVNLQVITSVHRREGCY